jgi:hypothetical protein
MNGVMALVDVRISWPPRGGEVDLDGMDDVLEEGRCLSARCRRMARDDQLDRMDS